MKDIDFDELDRAVSSLMNTTPNDKSKVPEVEAKPEEESLLDEAELQPTDAAAEAEPEPESLLSLEAPVISSESDLLQTKEPLSDSTIEPESDQQLEPMSEAEPETAPESSEESADSEPVAPRSNPTIISTPRRGRFMDVMRPASRDVTRTAASGTISRQGLSFQPISKPEQAEEPAALPNQLDGVMNQSLVEDPPKDDSATPAEPALGETATDMAAAFEDALSEIVDDTPPQSSPFLPDAKVEKRPLGRPVDTAPMADVSVVPAENGNESTAQSSESTGDSLASDTDAQLPEQPVPPEFGSELLSIETSTEHLPPEAQAVVTPEVTVEAGEISVSSPEPAPSRPRILETASIPQQYKVQPQQSSEAPVGAIYDTQPLAHPPEKKPGWMLIVSIIVIVLLGVGAGAAVYYLGLL